MVAYDIRSSAVTVIVAPIRGSVHEQCVELHPHFFDYVWITKGAEFKIQIFY